MEFASSESFSLISKRNRSVSGNVEINLHLGKDRVNWLVG